MSEMIPGASPQPVLCLASASPRRKALLASIGVPVSVLPSDIDETPLADESARAYVERLAVAKASAAMDRTSLPVLGSNCMMPTAPR